MGKNDIYMKSYLSDKARFTDLFNSIVGQGRELFAPDDVREINSAAGLVLQDAEQKESGVQKYRDIAMETKQGEKLILLAIENQEEIHYAMPVRSMLYDVMNYTNQVKGIARKNKAQGRLKSGGEYLSGLLKADKLCPVVTLIFYYGSKKWDGSEDIHGMLDLGETTVEGDEVAKNNLELLKKYIPNYKINLIQASDLTQNNSFKTDLQWMLGMLKYRENKKELIQYVKEHEDFFGNIDMDTFGAAKALLGSRNIPGVSLKKEGGIDMCKALDDWYQDGVKEGIEKGISQGISQGVEQGEDRFRRLCLKLSEFGQQLELEKAFRDKGYCKELYQRHSL